MRVQGHHPETESQPYAPTSPPKVVLTSPFQVRETKAGICSSQLEKKKEGYVINHSVEQQGSQLEKKKQPQYALQFNRGYMLEVAY